MNDKYKIVERLASLNQVILELGCGSKKKVDEAIGIDAIDYDCVDIVGDAFRVLRGFPSCSVDALYSFHFFGHITDIEILLKEIARVLKVGGRLKIVVPHFSNPHFYSDPTHRNFFGLYTLSYFSESKQFFRQVPTYNHTIQFSVEKVDLIFKSFRPFYCRHGIKKMLGMIFNSCSYMQEFYEENLCYLFPCYEISYELSKKQE